MVLDLKQLIQKVATTVAKATTQLSQRQQTNALRKQENALRRHRATRRSSRPLLVIAGAIAGALTIYFFDPERGRARRGRVIDWSGARLRRGWHSLNQLRQRASSDVTALPQKMISLRSGARPVGDLTLRDRVEREIFGGSELPRGRIHLDVESGVVTIRGQVDNAFRIAMVEKAVLKVPGVRGVENLLHVEGTPAPNRAQAREGMS